MKKYIEYYANLYNLPVLLVWAIVQVESGGDIYAWRVEPHYRYLVDVNTGNPFRQLTPAEIASEKAPSDFQAIGGLTSRDTEWWAGCPRRTHTGR